MNTKKLFRFIGMLMLIVAVAFVIMAISAPQMGHVFYIGSFKVDAHVKRIFYLVYLIAAVMLLTASFLIKRKKDR